MTKNALPAETDRALSHEHTNKIWLQRSELNRLSPAYEASGLPFALTAIVCPASIAIEPLQNSGHGVSWQDCIPNQGCAGKSSPMGKECQELFRGLDEINLVVCESSVNFDRLDYTAA